jgi:O-antigen ligase
MHIWLSVLIVASAIAFSTSPQLRARVMQAVDEVANADKSTALTSLGTRVLFYRTTLELIKERPIVGYGSGSFGKEYKEIVSRRYSDWRATPTTDPHNQYLFITMQLGIIGLTAFLAVIVTGFRAARASPYGWVAGGALAIWCVTSLFSSHFRTFPEGHLIGLFLGALLAAPIGRGSAPGR